MSRTVNQRHSVRPLPGFINPAYDRPEWQLTHSERHGNNRKMYAKLKRDESRAERKRDKHSWKREEGLA